jgi:hypothetical protein
LSWRPQTWLGQLFRHSVDYNVDVNRIGTKLVGRVDLPFPGMETVNVVDLKDGRVVAEISFDAIFRTWTRFIFSFEIKYKLKLGKNRDKKLRVLMLGNGK